MNGEISDCLDLLGKPVALKTRLIKPNMQRGRSIPNRNTKN